MSHMFWYERSNVGAHGPLHAQRGDVGHQADDAQVLSVQLSHESAMSHRRKPLTHVSNTHVSLET